MPPQTPRSQVAARAKGCSTETFSPRNDHTIPTAVRWNQKRLFEQGRLHLGLCASTSALMATLMLGVHALLHRGSGGAWLLLAPVVGIGTAGVLGLLLGLFQALVFLPLAAYLRRTGITAWFRLARHKGGRFSRTPVRLLHAISVQLTIAGAIVLVGLWQGSFLLRRIQDDEFRRLMLLFLACALMTTALGVAILLSPCLHRLAVHLDTRYGLPLLHGSARYLIATLGPLVLLSLLAWEYSDVLGVALYPAMVAIFLLTQGYVYHVGIWLRRGRRWPSLRRAAWLTLALCSMGVPLLLNHTPALANAASAAPLTSLPVAILRQVSDVDGDGTAGLYGGGDCAPLDPTINPDATDIPGNAKDEDCDGADAAERDVDALMAFTGDLPEDKTRPYNIIWIIADAFRPDRMSVYGAKRNTTPYLEQFAKRSVVFNSAYSQGVTTHISIPSMLAGRDAINMDWRYGKDKSRVIPAATEFMLAERLKREGYRTGAVVGSHILRLGDILQGFDSRHGVSPKHGASRTNHDALQFLAPALQAPESTKPFFLLVYYEDAHRPYRKHQRGEPHFGKDPRDRYDSELAFVDRYAGMLIEQIKWNKKLWKNTIIIFTADHGEEFKERGRTGHGSHCHEEVMHVPLLMRIPGERSRRVDTLVALVDIVPTILELVGHTEEPERLTGQSLLFPLHHAKQLDEHRGVSCVATKQGSSKGPGYYRSALRTQDYLLMQHRMNKRVEFFNLQEDAKERQDLADDSGQQPTLQALQKQLSARDTGSLWKHRRR
jgi:arylsulfatase A-like enzyme